jgi:hypothetical protein
MPRSYSIYLAVAAAFIFISAPDRGESSVEGTNLRNPINRVEQQNAHDKSLLHLAEPQRSPQRVFQDTVAKFIFAIQDIYRSRPQKSPYETSEAFDSRVRQWEKVAAPKLDSLPNRFGRIRYQIPVTRVTYDADKQTLTLFASPQPLPSYMPQGQRIRSPFVHRGIECITSPWFFCYFSQMHLGDKLYGSGSYSIPLDRVAANQMDILRATVTLDAEFILQMRSQPQIYLRFLNVTARGLPIFTWQDNPSQSNRNPAGDFRCLDRTRRLSDPLASLC